MLRTKRLSLHLLLVSGLFSACASSGSDGVPRNHQTSTLLEYAYDLIDDASDELSDLGSDILSDYMGAFSGYDGVLSGDRAIQAFSSDDVWVEYYQDVGYHSNYIDELLTFRGEHLSNFEQKHRASYSIMMITPPHNLLLNHYASKVASNAVDGNSEGILEFAVSCGVSVELMNHLLESDLVSWSNDEDLLHLLADDTEV